MAARLLLDAARGVRTLKVHVPAVCILLWCLPTLVPIQSQQPAAPSAPAAGLESLSPGMYYQSSEGWKEMKGVTPASLTVKRASRVFGGGVLEVWFNYPGKTSTVQMDNRRPTFGIRLDAASGLHGRFLMIIRLVEKKDRREMTLVRSAPQGPPVAQPGRVQATFSPVTEETCTLTPLADLKPGQYILIFNDAAAPEALGNSKLEGYDFDVK